MSNTTTTGARFIAETFRGYGVTHVFFVPTILMETLAAMENMDIRRIMVHGEKAAAYMADGYARALGRPGVCFAQNIGESNLAAGLRDAYLACSPVIALTGGTAPAGRYRHAYQELEAFTQFEPTTKFNAHVDDISRLPDMLRQAFREATTSAPGPVHLELRGHHGDVALAKADLDPTVEERYCAVPPFRPAADSSDVAEALKLLAAAERPMIVAGGGVVWSQAQAEVVALAEKLSVPVATSLNAKGAILDTHPLSVGVVGVYSRECSNRALAEADLVFFIGSHTGGQVTTKWQIPRVGTNVIHLDIDAREPGRNYPTKLALLGDARTVLRQMLDAAGEKAPGKRPKWLARVHTLIEEWRATLSPHVNSDNIPMRPERLTREISRALPEGGILVSDTGHSGIWTGTTVDFTKRGQRLIRSAGSLGWGLPGALGVKCALPDTPVICFAGDGGLYYHIAELETAARYGINLVLVVNNNSALNQEIPHVDAAHGGKPTERAREIWTFTDVNFADIAKSFGCLGIRIEDPKELPGALERAFAAGRPVVIDAVTDWRALAAKAWTGHAQEH